eukprot:scaffold229439_cov29-Tisochrysis_lutea.AAC.1
MRGARSTTVHTRRVMGCQTMRPRMAHGVYSELPASFMRTNSGDVISARISLAPCRVGQGDAAGLARGSGRGGRGEEGGGRRGQRTSSPLSEDHSAALSCMNFIVSSGWMNWASRTSEAQMLSVGSPLSCVVSAYESPAAEAGRSVLLTARLTTVGLSSLLAAGAPGLVGPPSFLMSSVRLPTACSKVLFGRNSILPLTCVRVKTGVGSVCHSAMKAGVGTAVSIGATTDESEASACTWLSESPPRCASRSTFPSTAHDPERSAMQIQCCSNATRPTPLDWRSVKLVGGAREDSCRSGRRCRGLGGEEGAHSRPEPRDVPLDVLSSSLLHSRGGAEKAEAAAAGAGGCFWAALTLDL